MVYCEKAMSSKVSSVVPARVTLPQPMEGGYNRILVNKGQRYMYGVFIEYIASTSLPRHRFHMTPIYGLSSVTHINVGRIPWPLTVLFAPVVIDCKIVFTVLGSTPLKKAL